MNFKLKYSFLLSLLGLFSLINGMSPGALFEMDYRKKGYGTIEDLEKILLLKIGIDPHYEAPQEDMNRIYKQIALIFSNTFSKYETELAIAVPGIDTTFVPGLITAIKIQPASPDNPEIQVTVSAITKVSPRTQFTEIFSSVGNHQKQRVLYGICHAIQQGQLSFEGKAITQSDLNRYIEWAYQR